ncbi:MAG: DUF2470 domain-containing protein [Motiliproteus sp.]|nr:DUF2470 domain-containing protein [Motiliproteus sp.]MCW9053820.1 DUF2470 domain-containing protein [Motiliproteus sp.]
MNTDPSHGLSAQESQKIVQSMNADRSDDLLLYAQVYGKQSGAKAASLVNMDQEGMDLELEFLYSEPKRLNIQFHEPIKDAQDAILHFDLMTQKAHDILGHNSNESIGRTIFKMLPEWLKH